MSMRARLAGAVEHTSLSPEATRADVERLVDEAAAHALLGVCVASSRVRDARRAIDRLTAPLRLVTVVGFPNGAIPTAIKAEETRLVVGEGADEVDVVVGLGLFRDEPALATADLAAVVAAAGARPVKVILETGLLRDDAEKTAIARCALEAGARFLKTSTGMQGRGGASVADVRLLRALAGERVGVKASGGIRSATDALALLDAGATRIGTSVGPRLLAEADLL